MILGLFVASLVLVVDQVSKYLVLKHMLSMAIMPFFNIVQAWNTGISFSMFSNGGFWSMIVLVVAALLIVAALLWWLKDEKNKLSQATLGMIIGGALGNVIDRVRFGAVFDFLDFYVGDYHWPAFNVADSFICIGAVILIVQSLLVKKGEK